MSKYKEKVNDWIEEGISKEKKESTFVTYFDLDQSECRYTYDYLL